MNFPALFSPLKIDPCHDLPRRLRDGFSLTPYNRATFYGGKDKGYAEYPVYDEMAPA
jgi:N-ethylmaleimide reductase